MKTNHIFTLILVCCATLPTRAYEFSFYNNTENPIAIAIQYTGNDNIKEPLYKQLVKPQSMVTFSPGKYGIPEIKWGFCLDQLYYVENPTQEQKNNHFEKAPWRKVAITWVQEKSTTKKTEPKRIIKEKDKPATSAEKSLCRDRHFDIIRDTQGKIAIMSSLAE
jgi:hypothetical protein